MSLIYITGPTGAGKTTICRELKARGYIAFDTDENGIAEHQDASTGLKIDYPSDPSQRTAEWRARHIYNLSSGKVEELAAQSKGKIVFLCGAAFNDLDFAPYFDKVICLDVDSDAAENRVLSRNTNIYGKAPDELQEIKARHDAVIRKYLEFGAHMVDADCSLEAVLASLLELSSDR